MTVRTAGDLSNKGSHLVCWVLYFQLAVFNERWLGVREPSKCLRLKWISGRGDDVKASSAEENDEEPSRGDVG